MQPLPRLRRRVFQFAALGVLAGIFMSRLPSPAAAAPAAAAQAAEPIRGMVGVGTWKTQAEFRDIKVIQGGKTLFASDFSKGLQGWKTIHGQWQVVDGVLRQASGEEDARALIGDRRWSNYILSLKARKLGGGEGFLILFGLPDENSKNWWNLGGWSNTRSGIEGPGVAGGQVPIKIETGRWYDVKVELSGATIRAYLDNQLIHTATQAPGTHTLVFNTQATGKKLSLTHWGVDTALPDPGNVIQGMLYMGNDQIDVIRVSFPIKYPLVNGDLPAAVDAHFTDRLKIAALAGDKPLVMLPDTDVGVNPWYKDGNQVNPERWVQLIKVAQRKYGKKMQYIEAFNEPDWGWGQGSMQNLNDILGVLRHDPEFQGVQMSGPSTLSSSSALSWYNVIKDRVERGTTHTLGGDMEAYVNFYKQVVAAGKVAENPEVHNLAEVISGAEYGLQSAIWWRYAELARGEFVKAVQGECLAYAEDRPRWTAAGVYRTPGGKVQAFVGCSERQGQTTTYRFIAQDRPVFFNGDGPRREFTYTIPGGLNAEARINVAWGQDVPPQIGGRYVVLNRSSGKVLSVAGANKENGAGIQQLDYTTASHQQWDVAPLVGIIGDQSYFTLKAVHSGKALDDTAWSHAEGSKMQQWGEGEAGAQNWYFDYAGDNYFTIRNRASTKCLEPANGSKSAGAAIVQTSRTGTPAQQWRLVPVRGLQKSTLDFLAPKRPSGLQAAAKPAAVELRWKADRDADLAGYSVFRATTAGGPYDTIARGVIGNSFLDNEAKEQRKYYYVIKAVDHSLNQSAFSAETSVTPGGPTRTRRTPWSASC